MTYLPSVTVALTVTPRGRAASTLRLFSALLALCCIWSFAGASVAIAAGSRLPAPMHSPFPTKRFPVLESPFAAAHGLQRDMATVSPIAPALVAAPQARIPQASSETLWDDTGHLMQPVAGVQVQAWAEELKTTRPNSHRAAELHLWLGEVAVARDKQPNLGMWHFRVAQHMASAQDPLHYLAAYDKAIGLFYAGAYQESEDALSHLLAVRHTADGFNRQHAALWLRHISGCVGYHAQHSALGIPEPPRLDPLCAAAALAARLRVMGLPSDKQTLLRACRVTGEGSNMQDILDAAPKLSVHAEAVTADDQGLIALPKPVVAYVEHDHFVALTRADRRGVSYLCSDCGPWPGGRVDLTWQQWHTMDAGLYVVVTPPGSAWDRTLTALKTLGGPSRQVASNHLSGVLPHQVEGLVPAWPALRGHILMPQVPVASLGCGTSPSALYCVVGSNHPKDKPKEESGSQEGDPVDLATGQEEYGPNPDLVVYNPSGPSITWQRTYQNLRGPGQSYPNYTYDITYQSDDFGVGWSQPYNVGVIVSGSTGTVLFANGSKIGFTFSGSPTAGHPLLGASSRSGVPLLLQWDYDGSANGHYEIIFKDRTHWITGSAFAPGSVLPLAQIVDRNGNSVYFNYPTVSASKASNGWPLLGNITTGPNGTGTVLLSIQRNTAAGSDGMVDSYITSVTDHPGTPYARSVFYQALRFINPNCTAQYSPYYLESSSVSQIVPGGSAPASAPSRFAYGYKAIPNGEGSEEVNYLHTVTTPSPTGSGTSTAYFWYMNDNSADASGKTNPNYLSSATVPFIGALVDANGNRRLYFTSDGAGHTFGSGGNYTQVTVQNSSGTALYSYQVSYDSNLNETGRTDGNGHVISTMAYANATSPYSPSTVVDGNGSVNTLLPYVAPGSQITLAGTQTSSNGPNQDWQITNASGTIVASNTTTNGWSVTVTNTFPPPSHYPVVTLAVTSPSAAAVGQYSIYDFYGSTFPVTANFALVAPPSNPNLGKTTYTYDQYGNVLTETSPRGTITTSTYIYPACFPLGELTQVQEGTNLSTPKAPTTYAYDDTDGYTDANGVFQPCGLLSGVIAPLPGTVGSTQTATTSYTYDVTGRGHQPLGGLGLGNILTITRPGNNAVSSITTTIGYTADGTYSQSAAIGQPLTVMDNLGKTTHLRYDSLGNTVGIKDALGNETDQSYTIGNEPLQTVLPATGQTGSGHAGSLISYLYSEPSSLATAAWPAASLQYGAGAMTTQYDEGNVGAIRQVVNAYGPEGELLSTVGSTEPVSYTYDALYRLSTLKDAAGNTTSYFYNPSGYLAQVVYPGAGTPTAPLTAGTKDTVSFTSYDGAGNVLSRTDGNNVTTGYAYNDPESRLTDITYPSGSIGNVHYAYDSYGRRSQMTDGTGSQTYAYDDDNALTAKNITWPGLSAQTVSYGFYPDGSRQTMTAAGHSCSYSYDGDGRMTGLLGLDGQHHTWSYQANGWLLSKTLAGIVTTNFTRDAQGRITDLLNSQGGSTLSDFHIPATGGYDGVGNRLSVTGQVATGNTMTRTYQYDYGQTQNPQASRSQLTQETYSPPRDFYNNASYAYDGGTPGGPGNPTTFGGTANTFNADNQITNAGYSYDGNGNPNTYQSQSLAFDPENRMTSDSTGSQTDGYDGGGLRTWKQTSSGKLYFLYDGTQPVVEEYSNGNLSALNTFGVDGLVSSSRPKITLYTFDDRGNVCQRVQMTKTVASTDDYTAYGSRIAGSQGSQPDPFGYGAQAGDYTDTETGLILCTHRFYDPSNGRWLTRDPMGYEGGINLYGYTSNDPGNRQDSSGYAPAYGGTAAPGAGITAGPGPGGTVFTYYPPPVPNPPPPQEAGPTYYNNGDGTVTITLPPGQSRRGTGQWRWDPGNDDEPCHYDYAESDREWRYYPGGSDGDPSGWQPKPGGLGYPPVDDGDVPRPPDGPPYRVQTGGPAPVDTSGAIQNEYGGGYAPGRGAGGIGIPSPEDPEDPE